jgi:hypothetical protein
VRVLQIILVCVPALAGAAAAAGAVAAMAAAVTCDASAAAHAPALHRCGARLGLMFLGPDENADRVRKPTGVEPDAIVCAPGVLQALASFSSTDCLAQGAAADTVARLWRTADANRARRLFAAGLRPLGGPQTFEAWVAEEARGPSLNAQMFDALMAQVDALRAQQEESWGGADGDTAWCGDSWSADDD